MNENIIAYLKEHGKVNINDLAAGLDMTGAEKFPLLVKEISQLESQGIILFRKSNFFQDDSHSFHGEVQ